MELHVTICGLLVSSVIDTDNLGKQSLVECLHLALLLFFTAIICVCGDGYEAILCTEKHLLQGRNEVCEDSEYLQ